jgi:hypothetical protein
MVIPTNSKITEQEQGRYVIDVLANMCSQGGELLIGVVSSNFDITEYTNSVREHVYELEQMKEENTLNLCELLPVDMKLHELEKEDQVATLKKDLLAKYQAGFHSRVQRKAALQGVALQLQQVQQATQPRTRSTSRATAEAKASTSPSTTGLVDDAEQQQEESPDVHAQPRPRRQWEGSQEQRDYETELAAGMEELHEVFRKAVLQENRDYRQALQQKQEAQLEVTRIKAELERYKIVESRASELTQ